MKTLPARLLLVVALVSGTAAVAVSKARVMSVKPAIHAPVADDGIPRPCTLCRVG